MKAQTALILVWLIAMLAPAAEASDLADDVAELRQALADLRDDYEGRIRDLEERLSRAERLAGSARRDADDAIELAEQTAIDLTSGTSAANTFNPAIGTVITGRYAELGPGWEEIPGFLPAGEIGTGESGFSLGEAEINLKANIDARFFGNLTLGVAEEDGSVELELEEAWLQTTSLPRGFSVTGGRFFSAAGYLNGFHFHADDFVDRPLPYQAFVGGRYSVDGVRARWVAPASLLFELGAELDWGGSFPATANGEASPGATTLFAKLGGDVGVSNSWQLGVARIDADAIERAGGHEEAGEAEGGSFTGDSDLTAVDFVWKWAPQGNPTARNLKLQAEYFRRDETGLFGGLAYDGDQEGWYLAGIWQFAPLWRVGARYDLVDADNGPGLAGTELEDPARSSRRTSLMLDYSPSEFSRLRLQYTNDRVLPQSDDQLYLQYIMSIGAHGAHQF